MRACAVQTISSKSVVLSGSHFLVTVPFKNREGPRSALLGTCLQTCRKGQRKQGAHRALADVG